jgi:prepilin-type N-terminal cleavage/methylation domain-containing protein
MKTSAAGFTLLEVLIAMGLLMGAVASLARLAAVATTANRSARESTMASLLAAQKLEQLRALDWTVGQDGSPSTDTTTDTAAPVEPSAGGTGLRTSPADSLARDVAGYIDHLDRFGRTLDGAGRPAGTRFVRRWSIRPLAAHEGSAIVLQVFVTSLTGAAQTPHAWRRGLDEAWLVSVKTRKPS